MKGPKGQHKTIAVAQDTRYRRMFNTSVSKVWRIQSCKVIKG